MLNSDSLIIISAPSGTGKGVLLKGLKLILDYEMPISATTRKPRPGELGGSSAKPYIFLSEVEFKQKIEAGEFAEWAEYGGHYYGTLREEIVRARGSGQVVIECEVNGARNLKRVFPDAVWIFLCPPGQTEADTIDCLRKRLAGRGTDQPEQIQQRLGTATVELAAKNEADYVVVNHNGRANEAIIEVASIIWRHGITLLQLDRPLG